MKFGKSWRGALGAWSLVAAGLGGGMPAAAFAEVLLNEILADPARDWDQNGAVSLRDDEWVEIVNAGSTSVILDGYRVASADTVWRYEFTGTLEPGGVRVVFGGESYAWESAQGFPLFGLRLNNSGGALTLWRLTAQDTVQVDAYSYQDHEAEDDRSSGRMPDGGADWRVFDALNPYAGATPPLGSGCVPSPGAAFACPTPTRPGTWGRLKQLYEGRMR